MTASGLDERLCASFAASKVCMSVDYIPSAEIVLRLGRFSFQMSRYPRLRVKSEGLTAGLYTKAISVTIIRFKGPKMDMGGGQQVQAIASMPL